MKIITKRTAKKYIKEIEKMLENKRNMGSPGVREFLTKKGFVFTKIGTGKQSQTWSKDISIKKLENTFIEGTFLCIGCANIGYGRGVIYQAYVIRIKE